MERTRAFLRSVGLPDRDPGELPESTGRFPDGARYRVEIPSVEGPEVLDAVLAEADDRGVPVHRVSQGSGAMLLTDAETASMVDTGAARAVEVGLFTRPLAGWDTGGAALSGGPLAAQARGAEQLVHCLEDIRRATELGIRSMLVTDVGVLEVAAGMRAAGELPADLRFKVSVQMGLSNPAAVRVAARLGADTCNVPTDLSLAQLAAVRQAVDIPLDIYVESPDDLGGSVRHYQIADLVRVAAPVYLKFGLRNAPPLYPSGSHLTPLAVTLGRERVRRAEIGLALLARYAPDAVTSTLPAPGLAVPVPPPGRR